MTATQPAPDTVTRSWPPGLPRSLDYPEVPVGSILRAGVRRWGDRTAFVDHDVPLTYTEMGARAHAVAWAAVKEQFHENEQGEWEAGASSGDTRHPKHLDERRIF